MAMEGLSPAELLAGRSVGKLYYDKTSPEKIYAPNSVGTPTRLSSSVSLTPSEIASPTAAILADTSATYIGQDFDRYYSNSVNLIPSGPVGSTYSMPPPTGIASTDQAALTAAYASGKKRIVFYFEGTYVKNSPISWTDNIRLVSECAYGTVIIQEATASTNTWMFVASSTPSNIGAHGITFDANGSARFVSTGTNTCGIFDFFVSAVTDVLWDECTFKNTRTTAIMNHGGTGMVFRSCVIEATRRNGFNLFGSKDIRWIDCDFEDYSTEGLAAPAIALGDNSGVACKGIQVVGCRARPLTSVGFFLESTIASGTDAHGVTFVANDMNGNAASGTGISGAFSKSVIVGNRFMNGGFNHRSGVEVVGSNNTVSGNTFENAVLYMSGGGAVVEFSRGNTVSNNTLIFTSSSQTSMFAISLTNQGNLEVIGNTVRFNVSGSATINTAIYVGGGATGPIHKARIEGNNLYSNGAGASGNAIRILTGVGGGTSTGLDYGVDIVVTNNSASGFTNGLSLPGNANDTYLTAINNDWRGCTNLSSSTATGTGNIIDVSPVHGGPWEQSVAFHATTMNMNLATGRNWTIGVLTANVTAMPDPTNMPAASGKAIVAYYMEQDGTGGRTFTWSSKHKGAWPTGSGTAGQKQTVFGYSDGTNLVFQGGSGWY